jgi:DNA polymerase delta subunit 3
MVSRKREGDLVFITSSCLPCLDQVTRVSHPPVSISEPATTPPATDVEMEDREPEPEPEPEPKRAPTRKNQRKPKKEVPVGRNGLKKRRVVKSRMTTDEKGYFGASTLSCYLCYCELNSNGGREVTEDYSSYESVDEEEEEAPPAKKPAKGKGKKLAAPVKVKDEGEAEEANEKEKAAKPLAKSASTLKRKPSKPSVQKGGGIASYFNKK